MKKNVIVAMLVALCAAAWATSPEELLLHAVRTKNIDKLQDVFRQEVNPNYTDASGKSALIYAYEKEWYEGVVSLLKKDVDVNVRDKDSKTALMYACEKQWYEGVKVLLEKGVDVNASKKDGKTALMYAVQKNNTMIVRWLVYENANINAKDFRGKTALMYAIEDKNNDIVDLLLRRRADLSATDNYGNNAAMYAVKYRNHNAVDKLLERSFLIDWNKTNNEGISPFALACKNGDLNIVKQILQKTPIEISDSRIDEMPILIWLIANKKSLAIIKYIMEYCNPEEIFSMTDDEGHDIKYWAEMQGYEWVLMRLAEIERNGLW